jgi:hypothetical protein
MLAFKRGLLPPYRPMVTGPGSVMIATMRRPLNWPRRRTICRTFHCQTPLPATG